MTGLFQSRSRENGTFLWTNYLSKYMRSIPVRSELSGDEPNTKRRKRIRGIRGTRREKGGRRRSEGGGREKEKRRKGKGREKENIPDIDAVEIINAPNSFTANTYRNNFDSRIIDTIINSTRHIHFAPESFL